MTDLTPTRPRIVFTDGWKYRLEADYYVTIPIHPPAPVGNRYIRLLPTGQLRIAASYCWDGPSGPTIDSSCFMRGSLVHDALYQLLREGLLAPEHRADADRILRDLCREDGMTWLRAWWVYQGVARFAGPAARTDHIRPARTAP